MRHIAVDALCFRNKTKEQNFIKSVALGLSKTSIRRMYLYYQKGSTAANKYSSFHSVIVKNFPMCPLQCGCQPTNQRHSATRQRGSDANLGATGNHYWHQAHCLPFFSPLLALDKQNGGSCSNGTQHKRCTDWIKYYQMILWTGMQFIPNDTCCLICDKKIVLLIQVMIMTFFSLFLIGKKQI